MMKNIENPNVIKQPPPLPKRTQILPNIDRGEKKAQTGMLSHNNGERRTTIEKKYLLTRTDNSKEVIEKRMQSKPKISQSSNKAVANRANITSV
jgi:hypothetical protein